MTDDFFDWHDRPVQERVIARTFLEHAGFEVSALESCANDPPDCEGILDGKRSAVELTRLNHEKARARNIKAQKEQRPGAAVYFNWDRDDLLAKVQELIDKKERDVKRYSGGQYDRYVLVLHTDEFVLTMATVQILLKGATFRTHSFTDVVLGLSYESGSYPAFRLQLK
jgi:hypothetical protein